VPTCDKRVEVPEQPLYFCDSERPATSLDVMKRQSNSKSRRHGAKLIVPCTVTAHASRDEDVTWRDVTRVTWRGSDAALDDQV